ncbi:hypothetical protein [Stenotrophomonas tumulicola]|uniref:Lipoprotein n=1 Tax=Stenotrophomonas tumulicola TaxID=1685415 RepID=A0A7W3IID2_9GAMM|nr:hypothetical protein [Stenotrophomonas tumulicola]MBA8683003.1 hypothetical protein [Stenotrophomonas tumulicola]
MIRYLSMAALAVSLAACNSTPVAQVQPIDGVISGQCHLDKVQGAVGLAASDATVERARVDSDSLRVQVRRSERERSGTTASGSVDPAAGASHDGGEQLTVETGRTNNITAIYCG